MAAGQALVADVAETVTWFEAASAVAAQTVGLSESWSVTESLSGQGSFNVLMSESMSLSATLAAQAALVVYVDESVPYVESVAAVQVFVAALSETWRTWFAYVLPTANGSPTEGVTYVPGSRLLTGPQRAPTYSLVPRTRIPTIVTPMVTGTKPIKTGR